MRICKLDEVPEERRGIAICRRNAHQALQRVAEPAAHGTDKAVGLGRGDTGFLRLVADVNLNQQGW